LRGVTGSQLGLLDFWGSFASGTRRLALFWHLLWTGGSLLVLFLLLLLRLLLLRCLLLLHQALLFFPFLSTLFSFLLTCRIFASATNFFFIYPLAEEKSGIRVPLCKATLVIGVLFEFGNIWRRLTLAVVILDVKRTALLSEEIIQWAGVGVHRNHSGANAIVGTRF